MNILSPKQQEIVENTAGAMLVLAGAGSGKTRILTARVRYLLEQEKGHFRVLALTFTNKAAEEMESRLTGIKDLKKRAFIGTIHKFCLEIIKSHGNVIGIVKMPHIFESEEVRKKIVEELFESNIKLKVYLENKRSEKEKNDLISRGLNFISQKKREELILPGDESFHALHEDQQVLYKEYNDLLSSQDAMDFDDVLILAYRIFIERPEVANLYSRLYKYVCIDEAQDLNFAQYEIIKAMCLGRHDNILMVGDPNQAIYGFNGADEKFMLVNFKNDFNAVKVVLKENYRSSLEVIRAANRLIPGSIDEENVKIKGGFSLKDFETEETEAKWVVAEIKELIEKKNIEGIEGEISLQHIAVLARNKYVFKYLEKELEKNRIEFFYKTIYKTSQCESDFMKIFDLGTRILTNPLDRIHFSQIRELLQIENQPDGNLDDGLKKLCSLKDKIKDNELKQQYRVLIEVWSILAKEENQYTKALEKLEAYTQGIRNKKNMSQRALILEDIKDLKDLWRKFLIQMPAGNRTLQSFKTHVALGITDTTKKQSGLTLGTIHSVKGLEYDIVFLIGMTDGTFPDYRAVKKGGKAIDEEKNNAFVAITRSKRLLYITYPKTKFMPWDNSTPYPQKPSRFLKKFIINND
ncbi:MAG: ATP-dependent helicase [Candidatus Aminicenantes bacterium]|nr:ATP-dependent helicase [Candidatus Aminicenantes bacterium]